MGELDLSRIVVLIPALNEAEALPFTLADLPTVGRVLVVDNGSTDGTAAVAAAAGAVVLHEPRRGYGSACLAGLAELSRWAASGEFDAAIVVFLDADHADPADRLPELVAPLLARTHDLTWSRRTPTSTAAHPWHAVLGTRLVCWLLRRMVGGTARDLGPFRAIRWEALRALGMTDRGYGWMVEMQVKAVRAGLRGLEIPMPYRPRVGKSKISGTLVGSIRAGSRMLQLALAYGLGRRG